MLLRLLRGIDRFLKQIYLLNKVHCSHKMLDYGG